MNDPKLFDAFNVPRPPRELAEDIVAVVRVWDASFTDAKNIANDLRWLGNTYSAETWGALSPLLPPVASNGGKPPHKTATEIFQILRIWGLSYRQMAEFVGRFHAVVHEKGRKEWEAWKPDIRPNIALPGISTPN